MKAQSAVTLFGLLFAIASANSYVGYYRIVDTTYGCWNPQGIVNIEESYISFQFNNGTTFQYESSLSTSNGELSFTMLGEYGNENAAITFYSSGEAMVTKDNECPFWISPLNGTYTLNGEYGSCCNAENMTISGNVITLSYPDTSPCQYLHVNDQTATAFMTYANGNLTFGIIGNGGIETGVLFYNNEEGKITKNGGCPLTIVSEGDDFIDVQDS